ncbi:MAG: hypothetical protein RLZZ144_973 [Pseudomonadota bacterium]|jgi:class 3 adenylate cyclase
MATDQSDLGVEKYKQNLTRSIIATVIFFDIVGYTKRPVNTQTQIKRQFTDLLSEFLPKLENGERIILDTGDGAAIGFLQHPEDALEVAVKFRRVVAANNHQNFPELFVRIGIHMGPINVVQDMNGQSNMVGDGINDAQRVMSFAGSEQIYVSRAYFDFISRLSHEHEKLFVYRGSQKDKHGRAHSVYELVDHGANFETQEKLGSSDINLEPFTFEIPHRGALKIPDDAEKIEAKREDSALMKDIRKLLEKEEIPLVTTPAARVEPQPENLPMNKPSVIEAPAVQNVPPVKVARVIRPHLEALNKAEAKKRLQPKSVPWGAILLVILVGLVAAYFVLK